jgi:hypothetical protein
LFPDLLNPEVQRFIDVNVGADLTALALRKNPFPGIEFTVILNQIAAKTKAKGKLPTWFGAPQIVYPSKISVEQTSSEKTALYKASLITGKSLIDLSGGFGVDGFYFAKRFENVVHCEMNTELSVIVKHNFEAMQIENIRCEIGDSAEILKQLNQQFDWIYIDPSRRNEAKGKVFMLRDCLPDVPDLLDFYLEFAPNILIKTAPVLDIAAGLSELRHVKKIHIVAVANEVKELLWEIEKGFSGDIEIKTVNLLKDSEEHFDFMLGDETKPAHFGLPKEYLYEPNAAIMKSGGFNAVGLRFGLDKLHTHSHLYTSAAKINFPGRIFEIETAVAYQKTELKRWLENTKANVTTRNFPDSVETIRKKWKITDGGDRYCFFTTDQNDNKIVLICSKIK